jgi:type II secretory pathway pseudopilin PulG
MKREQGFTLVEAAVAIGVVAILSGIIIPLVLKNLRDARNARARNDLNVIAGAIASQLKDTGSNRPHAATPFGPTGLATAVWFSNGTEPDIIAGAPPPGPPPAPGVPPALIPYAPLPGNPAEQSFQNLFTAGSGVPGTMPIGDANLLFGFPAAAAAPTEFRYKGPYVTHQVANKTDPWGRAYLILGYNQAGQDAPNGGPIWVVCAGEGQTINGANVNAGGVNGAPVSTWIYAHGSETNIAVQVH